MEGGLKHLAPQHAHELHCVHLGLLAVLRAYEGVPAFDEIGIVDLVDVVFQFQAVFGRYAAFGIEHGIDEEFEETGNLDARGRRVVLLLLLLGLLLDVLCILDGKEDV